MFTGIQSLLTRCYKKKKKKTKTQGGSGVNFLKVNLIKKSNGILEDREREEENNEIYVS